MVNQHLLTILVLGVFAAGSIAVPDQVDSWRVEGSGGHKDEEGSSNIGSTCVSQNELSALNQRIANIERRQEKSLKQVDELSQQTDLRFAKMQEENSEVLNVMTERNEEETKNRITQTTDMLRYLNESLSVHRAFCRSGAFGTEYYRGIEYTWPKTFTAFFDPPFAEPPRFTYGIDYLDSSYVRINTKILELGRYFAKIKVFTWEDKKLYGVRYRWIACP